MNNIPIQGIGVDIIEIERIQDSIEKHGDHFLNRIFTPLEISYCLSHARPETHFAGRFAAKEAISKALGSGFGKELSWKDLEILSDEKGKPIVHYQDYLIHLSISHCRTYAVAMAIVS